MILVGAAPTAMMMTMLRRGAPLRPRLTLALAGLGVGGLANVAMQMFHQPEISLMVLVWHLGAVAMLTALAAYLGPTLLNWSRIRVG